MDLRNNKDEIKSHSEIIDMIDEIRDFEDINIDDEIEEIKPQNDVIEVDHKELESEPEDIKIEDKKNFLKKIKFNRNPNIEDQVEKEIKPSVFKIGFDNQGSLVCLDLKNKSQNIERKRKFNSKKILSFIIRGKQDSTDEKDEDKSEGSKFSKIKEKLSGLTKIKNIIPTKSNKKDEEEKTEEGSE